MEMTRRKLFIDMTVGEPVSPSWKLVEHDTVAFYITTKMDIGVSKTEIIFISDLVLEICHKRGDHACIDYKATLVKTALKV